MKTYEQAIEMLADGNRQLDIIEEQLHEIAIRDDAALLEATTQALREQRRQLTAEAAKWLEVLCWVYETTPDRILADVRACN